MKQIQLALAKLAQTAIAELKFNQNQKLTANAKQDQIVHANQRLNVDANVDHAQKENVKVAQIVKPNHVLMENAIAMLKLNLKENVIAELRLIHQLLASAKQNAHARLPQKLVANANHAQKQVALVQEIKMLKYAQIAKQIVHSVGVKINMKTKKPMLKLLQVLILSAIAVVRVNVHVHATARIDEE